MKYKCENIKISFQKLKDSSPFEAVLSALGLETSKASNFQITRESLDSRLSRSAGIYYVYSATFDYDSHIANKSVRKHIDDKPLPPLPQPKVRKTKPVIIGAGPAGLFAAIRLVEHGFEPIILEMGKPLLERQMDVDRFFSGGRLDTSSNIQFGLGGAGCFSDAKLNTRIKNPMAQYIYKKLVEFGAPGEIAYQAKPHLGTDRVKPLLANIESHLVESGVRIQYSSKVTGIDVEILAGANPQAKAVIINDERQIKTDCIVAAIGNASRGFFAHLHGKGAVVQPKPFAVGFRMEHSQELINRHIYGHHPADGVLLKNAEYQLTYKDSETGRNVYTFCNCPGGLVVNSATEAEGIAVNGMSYSGRDLPNGNSALVVAVGLEDFGLEPLGAVRFQEQIERAAYCQTGSYMAPVAGISRFLGGRLEPDVQYSILPGYVETDFDEIFPQFAIKALRNALASFCARMTGFEHGILTAPETRTSSPVRLVRDKDSFEAEGIGGLFPVGEGSGYAGGIVSSALDGARAADLIAQLYS
ncbi:MAG: NAD(P)/FAD-dependent oxidoreductase [Eubacteriaceae bacterium]|nr:NAD(P)/FAD-dependent oxidoreductase [Eubacteriaceae bacterium]